MLRKVPPAYYATMIAANTAAHKINALIAIETARPLLLYHAAPKDKIDRIICI
jgi:hypothetical protein